MDGRRRPAGAHTLALTLALHTHTHTGGVDWTLRLGDQEGFKKKGRLVRKNKGVIVKRGLDGEV